VTRCPPPCEIISVYPHRWAVPRDVWTQNFAHAEEAIDTLTMAGLLLAEDSGTGRLFRQKAEARLRMLIIDPDSPVVALREKEEDTGVVMVAARVHNVLALLRPLRGVPGIESPSTTHAYTRRSSARTMT
jgi:hypothetical protein